MWVQEKASPIYVYLEVSPMSLLPNKSAQDHGLSRQLTFIKQQTAQHSCSHDLIYTAE